MTKKHFYALYLLTAVVVSVGLPSKSIGADNNKKQVAILSEPAAEPENAKPVEPVAHVQNQLGAMTQHVSQTTNESINQYLSSMSPAFKAAGGYFSNMLKQSCDWIVQYSKQNKNFSPSVKVTPVAERF